MVTSLSTATDISEIGHLGGRADSSQQRRWVKASREAFWQLASCARIAVTSNGPICTTRRDCWVRHTSHHHLEYVYTKTIHHTCICIDEEKGQETAER